jgi:hypothetical protein
MAGLSFGTEHAGGFGPAPKERPPQGNCDGHVYMEEPPGAVGVKKIMAASGHYRQA